MYHNVMFTTAATPLLVKSFVLVVFIIVIIGHLKDYFKGGEVYFDSWFKDYRESCLGRHGGSVMSGVICSCLSR